MGDDEVTIGILREIRDGIHQTNERLDQTNERLDQTNERLDRTRDELGRRITESELRTATAVTQLAGAVGAVKDLLADRLDVRDRVDRCEDDIAAIKRHVGL